MDSNTPATNMKIKKDEKAFCTLSNSFAPKNCELSDAYRIPIRITTQILYLLTELNIIIEVNYGNDDRVAYYQPAIDVNKITVSYLLTRMDEHGSENFKIDTSKLFSKEWKALLKTREDMIKANDNILLKDL